MGNGEVWWAEVPNDKIRPVVVLTRSRVADRLHSVVVGPSRRQHEALRQRSRSGRQKVSAMAVSQTSINTMLLHRSALGRKCGQVNASRWPEFCRAIHKMMGC